MEGGGGGGGERKQGAAEQRQREMDRKEKRSPRLVRDIRGGSF